MKAAAVIEQYKNGRRDFRGESLRGGNFRSADLAGADFSGCDIRGANFSRANLTGVKFAGVKAGLPKRWLVILLGLALVLIVVSSFFSSAAAYLVGLIFDSSSTENQVAGWSILILLICFCAVTWRKNILAGALAVALAVVFAVALAVALALAGAVAGVLAVTLALAVARAVALALAVAGALAVALAVAGAGAGAVAVALAVAGAGAGAGAVAVAVAVARAVALAVASAGEDAVSGAGAGAVSGAGAGAVAGAVARAVAGALTLLFCWLGWLTLKQEHRDPWLRKIVIAFAAIGGTSFFQANLTEADFTGATLKSTNFNQAILNKTIFKQAIKLELARPGNTLLANPRVREFLIDSRTGSGKDFAQANLRGAYLEGANLQAANLRLANISEASLQYANLAGANLTEVNAVNADLRHATLTGACVENWNIDATTQLDEVDCQYIYLLNGQKERRPSSGEFQPGEFTKLFAEMFDTVDLIFRNGVDWKAFIAALKEVQVQNEDTPLQIQSIANKGDGVIVVKVHVPPDTDKEKIHQEFNQNYQLQLAAIEAQYKAQLTAKETEIAIYRQQSVDMMEIMKTLANRPIHVEAKAMSHSNDSSQNTTIGYINNSAVNFGEIIGDVTNTINQIAADASPENAQLKALLQELTQAIEIDSHLDAEEKAEAANQVKKIAQASQNPDDAGLQKKAQRAVNFLETIAKALEPASKLAQACQKALPIILGILGF
ncbi:MAG: pentapeptide repeat-containing protein [Microcystis sp. M54BS1]|uniref:pentapeptide repeat-containing protein n=1 Tax=unclassified Microcystis TaxID=2643300 RepID=UPI00257AE006|nr:MULTISPECIES: pentapeptide repeat-containing protein [unclassified Microcystis]MCA2539733.1 pentapeptide repeat-containing protein [Microcystis sp. M54BS1]MCA2594785.1 pentapeptide repeat-containing protein [Microcystis sp. M38BS1]MCA2610711.1 pentapeptide repeat-containing protein [Microcystis sp. M27BS1]MCA2506099.1 pentapeptide repeat-containing protein [Microcystis sp. M62BS1]MCA2509466.1 pentapeptide repeat-containing protein [Microcystis sp. M60BS1]